MKNHLKYYSVLIFFIIQGIILSPTLGLADPQTSVSAQTCLAPEIILSNDIMRNSFFHVLRDIDKTNQTKYESIFSLPKEFSQPRWILNGKDLRKLLEYLNDINLLATVFDKRGSVFQNVLSDGGKEYIHDIVLIEPEYIDVASEDEYAGMLKQILQEGLKEIQRLRHKHPDIALAQENQSLLNRFERKFCDALALLSPHMPIDYIQLNEDIRQQLPKEVLERIKDNISWKKVDPDDFSGNRKIILKLDNPLVTKSGKEITALEIKGVVYRKDDAITPPLQEFYRDMAVQRLDKKQSVHISARTHLRGALPLSCAKREYMILRRLQKEGKKEADFPIGFGGYQGYTYHGKKFGFLITGVSQYKEERLGDWFLDRYFEVIQLTRSFNERFASLAVEMLQKHPERMRKYGQALRKFHDKGYYHGYPHILNATWDDEKQEVQLNDFEASKVMENLEIKSRVGYRLLDLSSAYSHFLIFMFGDKNKEDLIALSKHISKDRNPFYLFLEGYFGKKFENNNLDKLFNEFVELSCCGIVEPLYEMDDGIVKLLIDIERNKPVKNNKDTKKSTKKSLVKSILLVSGTLIILGANTALGADSSTIFDLTKDYFIGSFLTGFILIIAVAGYLTLQKAFKKFSKAAQTTNDLTRREFLKSSEFGILFGFLMVHTGGVGWMYLNNVLTKNKMDKKLRPLIAKNLRKLAAFYESLPDKKYADNKRLGLPMTIEYWKDTLKLDDIKEAKRSVEIYKKFLEEVLFAYSNQKSPKQNLTTPQLLQLIANHISPNSTKTKPELLPEERKQKEFTNGHSPLGTGVLAAMTVDSINNKPLIPKVEKTERTSALNREKQKEAKFEKQKRRKQRENKHIIADTITISQEGKRLSKIFGNMKLIEQAI